MRRFSPVFRTHHIRSRLSKRLCGAVLAALLLNGPAAAADGGGARAVVEGLNAALLESMRNAQALGYAGRHELLAPVLTRSFDFPFMTRIAVGRAWTDLSAPQRAQVVDLFAEMSIANFAARFDGFSGERFAIVDERPGPRDAVVIESQILRPADGPVGLHYVLRERSEFSAVLKSGGLPDLIATLEHKIQELSGNG
jgi:phospholipid transport system substrate-binding protein